MFAVLPLTQGLWLPTMWMVAGGLEGWCQIGVTEELLTIASALPLECMAAQARRTTSFANRKAVDAAELSRC